LCSACRSIATVLDLDPDEVRNPAIRFLDFSRNGLAVALDLELDDRTLLLERFPPLPGCRMIEPLEVGAREGQHVCFFVVSAG
jgi:hypothetical protein